MAFRAWHDVQEGQRAVVFVDLVRGNLAAQDLREDVVLVVSGHGRSSIALRPYNVAGPASIPGDARWFHAKGRLFLECGLHRGDLGALAGEDRKSTRLNSSH